MYDYSQLIDLPTAANKTNNNDLAFQPDRFKPEMQKNI